LVFLIKDARFLVHPNFLDEKNAKNAWALRRNMGRDYDIFEVLSAGVSVWKATIDNEVDGLRKLEELANGQSNEFRLIHRPTLAIVATRNDAKG
jgi:hypothetical protein